MIDASVIPRIPSAATHAPVIAIAERAADLLLGNDEWGMSWISAFRAKDAAAKAAAAAVAADVTAGTPA